jgi:putative redox protein
MIRNAQSQFGVGPFQQKLVIGEFQLLADVEAASGGANTGPSPHEYLAAALASCTSMTLKMYAGRKSMSLSNAIVTVHVERQNDIEKFTRDIQLFGELAEEEKQRLLEIANRCPIHKALTGEIQIKTQLVN